MKELDYREIAEKQLGRKLTKEEVIHHQNLNHKDNRIENLMIFPNQKEHAKWHVKLKKFPYLTNPMKREIELLSLKNFKTQTN